MNGDGIAAPEGGQVDTVPAAGVSETWFGGFPDELKGNELISGHDGPESMAKAYLETNTKYNELQTSLPTPAESPDAYQFDIPEGTQVDEAMVSWFRQTAFEGKIPPETAKGIVSGYLQKQQEANERAQTEFNQKIETDRTNATDALKKDWGVMFQANVDGSEAVLNRFASEKSRQFIRDSGIGREPEFIKMLHEIKSVLSEGVFVAGDPPPKGQKTDGFNRPILDFPSMEK